MRKNVLLTVKILWNKIKKDYIKTYARNSLNDKEYYYYFMNDKVHFNSKT